MITMKSRKGPLGVHLFDRDSGLNVLIDEIRVPQEQWSVAPRYVSVALTNSCELSCSYCYAPKHGARLPPADLVEWAQDLDENGCFGLGLGGGEPTLYPGFVDLCLNLHSSTSLAITMTTHGHRFTPALSAQLQGSLDFIRLSMDGIGPTYERLRGRPFALFEEKLALVRDTARFGINYVVNDETIDDLPDAAEFAFAAGAEEFLLLPQVHNDGTSAAKVATVERLSVWARHNYDRCRLATSRHGGGMINAPMLPLTDVRHESHEFLHIDASGVLKLSAFAGSGLPISGFGSIMETVVQLRQRYEKQNRMEVGRI